MFLFLTLGGRKKRASYAQIPILTVAPDTCNEQKLICKVTELLLNRAQASDPSDLSQGCRVAAVI